MNALTNTVARVLFALPFGVFGILHFINASYMAALVPVPGGIFWIYITGLIHLGACVSIISGKKVRLMGLILGIMLLIFVLTIHLPGIIYAADAAAMQASLTPLLKDVALAGGAWFIAGRYEPVSSAPEAPAG